MARPREFEEDEVLDKAADVFGQRGFDGSTMAELTSAMRLKAPSIYAAFGSKRGLFDAVLRRCFAREHDHWAWALSASTAGEVVERLLTGLRGNAKERALPAILVQAGMAIGVENADIPAEAHHRRRLAELKLRDRFEEAKLAGDLPGETDSLKLAHYVTAVRDGLAIKAADSASSADAGAIAAHAVEALKAIGHVASTTDQSENRPLPDDQTHRRRRRFQADAALDAAMKIFWAKGFTGASLNDLTQAMGITRPSLYSVYGNKEELFYKALDRYQSLRMDDISEALDAPTARDVFKAMLQHALRQQLTEDQPRGCLIVLNAMQAGEEAESVRNEALARLAAGHDLLVGRFERARIEGDLPETVSADGLARSVQSLVNGIIIQGASGASENDLKALVDSSLTMWTVNSLPLGKDNC